MIVKLPEKTGRDYQLLQYYEAWAWKLDEIEYSAVLGLILTTVCNWAVTGDRQNVPPENPSQNNSQG